MSKINTFLQKMKMQENHHGIYMVIAAYILSFLMLIVGSDSFYNIHSRAAGDEDHSDEVTHELEDDIQSSSTTNYSAKGMQMNLVNPYGIVDDLKISEVTASNRQDDSLGMMSGDTNWLLGNAMSQDEYLDLMEQIAELEVSEEEIETTSSNTVIKVTKEERKLLEQIVAAEAEGEDIIGKILIVNVILNRMADDEFPDTIKGVIYHKVGGEYQFSPLESGRFGKVKISDETKEAVDRALEGEDYSEGALYFMARKRAKKSSAKWFDNNLTWLFKHGGHEFYKDE